MIITVDTGATKTLVAAFENNKKASQSHRFATPKDSKEYIETLSQLLSSTYDLKKASAISIGSRGFIDNDTIVEDARLGRKNFKIVDELRQKLQTKLPIFLENDANLAGLAEIHSLPVRPAVGLYVTISTGIGTGVITDGVINKTLGGSEGGNAVLEYDGILRSWESFASGSAIYETYGKFASDIHDHSSWEIIADKISRGFLAIIPFLRPDFVVIGGSIGTYFSRYQKPLQTLLREKIPAAITLPHIVEAKHPEEAVIYGCNIYANQKLGQ